MGLGPDAFELGFRDLDPEESPPQGSGAKLEDFFPFNNGNTINIKFWIGFGAFCLTGDPNNCGECLYTTSGADDGNNNEVGRACNASDEAGVFIPANTPAVDGVLVIPERIVGEVTLEDGRTLNCTPDANGRVDFIQGLDIPQYPGCFTVRTIPPLDPNVDIGAIVGICPEILDVPNVPDYHPVIHRTDDATDPTFVEALNPGSTVIGGVDFLNCEPAVSPVQSLVRGVWRKLSPFAAEPAYGSHRSLKGADAPSFSEFVWAVSSQEAATAGDNQTGLAGSVLPVPLTVQVTDRVPMGFWDPGGTRTVESMSVAGATVTLDLRDGVGGLTEWDPVDGCLAGSATELQVTTGPSGAVKVCVTLPGVSGTYHIDGGGYGIGVTGTPWTLPPAGTGVGPYSHYALTSPGPNPIAPIRLPQPFLPDPRSDLVTFTVTACAPGEGSATIDGIFGDGEWDCSETPAPFEAHVPGGDVEGLLYRMQSDGTLYFAVVIPILKESSLKQNTWTLYLNDEGATQLADGHDILVVDGTLPSGVAVQRSTLGGRKTPQRAIVLRLRGHWTRQSARGGRFPDQPRGR